MTNPLPTPRALLSTLLTSLSSPPATDQPSTTHAINPPYDTPTNPLKDLPKSHRALLTTLHVLLPTGVLLQALDLLDRGLVVRVVEQSSTPESNGTEIDEDQGSIAPPQTSNHLHESSSSAQLQPFQGQGEAQARVPIPGRSLDIPAPITASSPPENQVKHANLVLEESKNNIYLVRSSQAPRSRFKDPLSSTTASNLVYTVRLEAWNCSCAAFAFEAFPGMSSGSSPWLDLEDGESDEEEDEGVAREFGGLSFHGREDETEKVPVCKHLLACLLAERWESVLSGYVKERVVGRQEMAGVGGEG